MSSKSKRATALGLAPEIAEKALNMNVETGKTATGTTIADAYDLVAEFTEFSTVAASTGCQLPDWPIGSTVYVKNSGANTLNVFPHSATGNIFTAATGAGAGTAITIATVKKGRFHRLTATNWDYTLEN